MGSVSGKEMFFLCRGCFWLDWSQHRVAVGVPQGTLLPVMLRSCVCKELKKSSNKQGAKWEIPSLPAALPALPKPGTAVCELGCQGLSPACANGPQSTGDAVTPHSPRAPLPPLTASEALSGHCSPSAAQGTGSHQEGWQVCPGFQVSAGRVAPGRVEGLVLPGEAGLPPWLSLRDTDCVTSLL